MAHHLLLSKTAAITGGTTGIGRAIALEFLRQGSNVAINHLNLPSDAHHKDSLLAEAAALKQKDDKAGKLIENPANNPPLLLFSSLDHDLFASTVRINLDGAFYSCQAAARQMALQNTGGSIIAISSISALVGGGLQTHYTPTKAGVLSLMQSMAVALGKYKIRCNALLPGTIKTQLNEEDLNDDEKRRYMETRIPLGRTGEPKDMAGPAVFLACEELSGYVNGAQLLVDGGLFVNLQ
ncbi:hypothetical protein DL95DRAFT_367058 [Leptodontidium sp. 2 PMI_412]|nr:hypothetical protein DL95DRAFT_367058 [Leptodontidium sp. 2 PMI_412]